MKKCLVLLLVLSSLSALAAAQAMSLMGTESPRPFCQQSLPHQVKKNNVIIVKARVDVSLPMNVRDNTKPCTYEVSVTQTLREDFAGLPNMFKLEALTWNATCEPVDNQIFIVLKKEALNQNLKTCDYAAVVHPLVEKNIPDVISQKTERK